MSQKEPIAKAPRQRPQRAPLGTRQPLRVRDKDPNYEYRIVNDVDDRVLELQERGYEVVPKSAGNIGDKRVDVSTPDSSAATRSVGNGIRGVLMRIPKDWYQEDQEAKQERVNASERTIKEKASSEYSKGKFERDDPTK